MNEKITFETVLKKDEKSEATAVIFPFDIEKTFGAKRVPVKVWINEAEYLSTIVKMHGEFFIVVPKRVREVAKIEGGETVIVTIQRDTEKRIVEVPEDFAKALKDHELTEAFAKMSYTHQKEYVVAITEAKKEETRLRRIEKAIETIGKK